MRVLASMSAVLALGGAVAAAPVEASDIAPNWNQTEPIPASAILAPGVVDDVFTRTSPRDGDNPLLAKRDFDEGGCYPWLSWVSSNQRQGYYNDFAYAHGIFQGYDRWGYNWVGPMQQANWSWGSFRLTIRNQDQCSGGVWRWDDVLDMMDYMVHWDCAPTKQGWGYVAYAPTLVAMVYFDGYGVPGFQPGCNHTGLKKLLKAKSEEVEAAAE
ncbi:hypothetical protein N658DRAFT_510807 [Parathielavia hyrcaniae]|uniref:Secreted protein n=1 Tax=Parathielavia hyrcaniae TaxID=113614 RepID=A0AAN6PS34_9PEZI|nr:hypothetical protein N658DRAFT_510807 [Parathielavia hyrcaniae]